MCRQTAHSNLTTKESRYQVSNRSWSWTHLELVWREGTELALRKPSLMMERRHDSFSDLDRTGGPQSSLEPPRSPAPEALRVTAERDVSAGTDGSGWANGAKLSSMICLALSQI